MESYETRLETARRRIEEQEKLVAIWRETISGLAKEGPPTDLAEKMLQLMEAQCHSLATGQALGQGSC